jgi:hypothetical protein
MNGGSVEILFKQHALKISTIIYIKNGLYSSKYIIYEEK